VDDLTDLLNGLLTDARGGDRVALTAFVRATQPEVWRLARHLVGQDDADEVTQDTYVRAWKALPSFRGDASARTWLLAIARRACADAVRQHTRRRRLRSRVEAQPLTLEAPDVTAYGDDLLALVDGLPEARREAFVLTQVLGCSYDEAARIADVPVGTIRSRVARARESLVEAVRAADAM
jgi:RNA polymerase sigma-70 factor (ECF subfamily)